MYRSGHCNNTAVLPAVRSFHTAVRHATTDHCDVQRHMGVSNLSKVVT